MHVAPAVAAAEDDGRWRGSVGSAQYSNGFLTAPGLCRLRACAIMRDTSHRRFHRSNSYPI
jgi:hypothetical protein